MRFIKYILLVLAFVAPCFANTNLNNRTLQESLDSIDNWLGALAVSSGSTNAQVYLPGTNIVGATYDDTDKEWFVDFPGVERESSLFFKPQNVSSSVVVSITNGQYQYLLLTNNTYISFEPPSLSRNNEIYLWVQNSSNFTVNFDSSFVVLDTNAPSLTNSVRSYLFRYRTNPYFSKWTEQYLPVGAIAGASGGNTNTLTVATGGVITTNGSYVVHTFNSNDTFTVNAAGSVDLLLVGGGGGGGRDRGGGGGGGVVQEFLNIPIGTGAYSIVVGSGGLGSTNAGMERGTTGSNSTVVISGVSYTARGGTGGGDNNKLSLSGPVAGGNGAGKSQITVGTLGGDGGEGRSSGGGGGGGMVGNGLNAMANLSGGNGGSGLSTTFRSTSAEFFGGGGGGGVINTVSGPAGAGGSGGGGAGGKGAAVGSAGTNNTGGGGGGGGRDTSTTATFSGGNGGSGVVIVRYLKP